MKVLVFGQSGQVARCLADSQPANIQADYLSRVQADFSTSVDFDTLISSYQAQAVINATAYTAVDKAEEEPDLANQVNGTAIGALAKAAQKAQVPLLHISTDYVFDGELASNQAYTEVMDTNPQGLYGASKLLGEQGVLAANQQTGTDPTGQGYVFRTAWVYSAYGKNFLKTMLALAQKHKELRVVGDQWGTPTSAHDIATALWQALARITSSSLQNPQPSPGVYHLVAGGHTSWHGFAVEIFEQAAAKGWPCPEAIHSITTADFPTPAKRPSNSQLDTSLLAQSFDINLPQWNQSITQVLERLQGDV